MQSRHKIRCHQDTLLQAIKCIVGNRRATYVSGPITTGPRFIDWYIKTGHMHEKDKSSYQSIKFEEVISLNETAIIAVAEELRELSSVQVIEPASLHITSWTQQDYYQFWTELMRRFVMRVVVLDGWQYSIGCVIEFHHAIQCGIHVETIDGMPLNEENARKFILEAAEDIELRGSSFELLKRMAQKLKSQELLYGERSA